MPVQLRRRVLERHVQDYFLRRVKALRPFPAVRKFDQVGGWPDFAVFFHPGRVALVELKRPGGRMRPQQLRIKRILGKLLHEVTVLDSREAVDRWIEEQQDELDAARISG